MPRTRIPAQHILVIDDDPVMRELLLLLLTMEGHTVVTAASGEDGLALIASLAPPARPSLVLSDLQMPGLCGADLASRLRAELPSALLMAMSGSGPSSAEAFSFDAFLHKPFTARDFATAVAQTAVLTAKSSRGRRPPDSSDPSETQPLNETIYARLAASMPPAQLKELYTMCLDDALRRISRMSTAAAAKDASVFTAEAHAIKGGCSMLGASELHLLASRMETGALLCTSLLKDFGLAAARLRRMLDARS